MDALVIMDWKDGKIVGLEVLDAASLLHPDLLASGDPKDLTTLGVEVSSLGDVIDSLLLKAELLVPNDGNYLLGHDATVARNMFQKSNTSAKRRENGYRPILNNVRKLRDAILQLRNISLGLPVPGGKALEISKLRDGRTRVAPVQLAIAAKRDNAAGPEDVGDGVGVSDSVDLDAAEDPPPLSS